MNHKRLTRSLIKYSKVCLVNPKTLGFEKRKIQTVSIKIVIAIGHRKPMIAIAIFNQIAIKIAIFAIRVMPWLLTVKIPQDPSNQSNLEEML